jgi:hypothetical protein
MYPSNIIFARMYYEWASVVFSELIYWSSSIHKGPNILHEPICRGPISYDT